MLMTSECKAKHVLTLLDHYLPGVKFGGPLRTVANMVQWLGQETNFEIITRDRDLGDSCAYADVPLHTWASVGDARVMYISPEELTFRRLYSVITQTQYDIMYMNSFLSRPFTLKPMLLRHFGKITRKPVVIAPRGEFSPGALALQMGAQ